MKTPWQQAKAQQKSQRQESRIGDMASGKKQVNSGRHWFSKRDVRLGGFLVEARITDAKSYSVNGEEFSKLTRDAMQTPPGMLPAMALEIQGQRLIVMREEDFLFMEERVGILDSEVKRLNSRSMEEEDGEDFD
jgi:hypothetical protein